MSPAVEMERLLLQPLGDRAGDAVALTAGRTGVLRTPSNRQSDAPELTTGTD